MYVFFPVAMFFYFNMPESYEDFMTQKKVCECCFSYSNCYFLFGLLTRKKKKKTSVWCCLVLQILPTLQYKHLNVFISKINYIVIFIITTENGMIK